MKYIKSFLEIICLLIDIIFILLLCLFLWLFEIIKYEAITLKEYPSNNAGDCRIVNTKIALDEKLELRLYKQPNNKFNHILAITRDGIIVDKSRITERNQSLDGKHVNDYHKKNILIYRLDENYNEELNNIWTSYPETISQVLYINIFVEIYNKHKYAH